jgi:hypothetical protein
LFHISKGRRVLKQLQNHDLYLKVKTNLPSLTSAPFFRPFFLEIYKILQKCEQNEIYLQEIYQSSNQEMFAISLSSCSRYNANFKLDQSQCSLFMTVRHIFEISEDDHPRTVTHARDI